MNGDRQRPPLLQEDLTLKNHRSPLVARVQRDRRTKPDPLSGAVPLVEAAVRMRDIERLQAITRRMAKQGLDIKTSRRIADQSVTPAPRPSEG